MDSSFPGAASLYTQISGIFNVTQSPSSPDSGLTAPSFNEVNMNHGCVVLKQTFHSQNKSESIISNQVHFWVRTFAYVGVGPLLFMVGVPANILSAAVFYKHGLSERINFCTFSLAIVDLVVITLTFVRNVEGRYREFVGPSNISVKYFLALSGFYWVSMFLSTVIAAERCFCVVSPLRALRMLSTRTLAVIVISISVVLLTGKVALATGGLKQTEACVSAPSNNSTSYIVHKTGYDINNKEIIDIFETFVYATALPVFFFVVIVITTIITTVKLQSVVRWRQQSSSASGKQPTGSLEYHMVSLTRMLIGTSVLFVVCLCPILFVLVAMFLVPGLTFGGRYHNLLEVLWSLVFVLRFVNSTLNFFIYYKMGSRFRQTLRQLLSCKESNISKSHSDLAQSSKKPVQSNQRLSSMTREI